MTDKRPARSKPADADPVVVGQLIDGKYRVERIVATGGMGLVVCARHETLSQQVAIKFVRAGLVSWQTVARFLREAKAAARIHSPHVAQVFDCGRLEDGTPYMVM